MKQTSLFAAGALAIATITGGGVHVLAKEWQRIPERPHKAVEESAPHSPVPERRDPKFTAIETPSGRALFSDERADSPKSSTRKQVSDHRVLEVKNLEITGNIFGVVNSWTDSQATESDARNSFWGKINFSDLSATPLYRSADFYNSGDPTNQTGAVRNGILYIPEGIRSSVRDFEVIWKRFDIENGKWLSPLFCGDNLDLWMFAMTYDPVTDAFYGMCAYEENGTTNYNRIVRVDLNPVTGIPEATVIKDYPTNAAILSGFFYNPGTEKVCTFTNNGRISSMDRTTGELTTVCNLYTLDPADEDVIYADIETNGPHNIVYSPRDKKILMTGAAIEQNAQKAMVYACDLDDGEVIRLGTVDGGYYFRSLYTPDTYAEPDAADQVEIVKINLDKNSLSGSIDVKMPATLYNGIALTAPSTLVVTADGNSIYNKEHAAGSNVNVPFTLTDGLHKIVLRADISATNPGPDRTIMLYTGNDIPLAPTGLALNGTTLSWTAPGAEGQNRGYVETSNLTYDVYFDDVKQNSQPISGTSYTITPPADMVRTVITVTASASGKTSLPSNGLEAVIGNALSLPYTATPEAKQAELFTIIDGNHDGSTFSFDSDLKAFYHQYETYENSNEWLILPALYIDDASKMHEFAISFATATPYYGTENVELCIGTAPSAASMRTLVRYTDLQVASGKTIPLTARFNVDQPGAYYLAVHPTSSTEGAGSVVSNIRVNALESTTGVPSTPTQISIEAAPLGALEGIIKVTIPSTDASGKALAVGSDVTVKVANFDQDAAHTATATGKPGDNVSVKCVSNQGFNSYLVSLSNASGESCPAMIRGYIGIDIPKIVTGFRGETSADNMSMRLYWDPVTEGVNGGYIDPENVRYQVWYNPSGVTWARVGEPVETTAVDFMSLSEDLYRYRVSVFAQNSAGFLKAQTVDHVVEDVLGRPVEFPMVEPFGISGVAYRWNYEHRDPSVENSMMRQILNDELPLLGIGNPVMDDGSGRLVTRKVSGQSTEAELLCPKVRTEGQINPTFCMRYWSYSNAAPFVIYARKCGDTELHKIGEFTPSVENFNSWIDYRLPIPEEYQNEQWVQFRIHFYLSNASNCYGLIDDINIISNVDTDVKLSNVSSEPLTHVGDNCSFEATAINAGQNRVSADLKAQVIADGKVTDEVSYPISRLNSLRTYTRAFTFTAKPDYANAEQVIVRFTVETEGDMIPDNNSREVVWQILPSVRPGVTDLAAGISEDGKSVNLTWTKPMVAFGSFDDCEFMEPFAYGSKLGQWTNVNNDPYYPYGIGIEWPGYEMPRAWQVIDTKQIGTDTDPRMGAHSGNRMLMAMSGYDPNNESAQVQVSKWLISPEVKGGTRVKFWVNTPSTSYRETLHVYYSTTDTELSSFTKLCNRSKEGDAAWEQTYFDLPENAKYFALVYVGWDTLGITIDDIEYEPANPIWWDVESYDVYCMRDGEEEYSMLGNVAETGYSDAAYDGRNAFYYVITHAGIDGNSGVGPMSNIVEVTSSGVNVLDTLEGVSGGKGEIIVSGHDGERISVYSSDGKRVDSFNAVGNSCRRSASAGVYIVMAGKKSAKIMVK